MKKYQIFSKLFPLVRTEKTGKISKNETKLNMRQSPKRNFFSKTNELNFLSFCTETLSLFFIYVENKKIQKEYAERKRAEKTEKIPNCLKTSPAGTYQKSGKISQNESKITVQNFFNRTSKFNFLGFCTQTLLNS